MRAQPIERQFVRPNPEEVAAEARRVAAKAGAKQRAETQAKLGALDLGKLRAVTAAAAARQRARDGSPAVGQRTTIRGREFVVSEIGDDGVVLRSTTPSTKVSRWRW